MLKPDFEVQTVSAGNPVYTEPFAAPDRLAVQVLVEKTDATGGTLTVTPQHSGDGGRNWIDKTALTLSSSGAYTGQAVTPLFGADDGTSPSLPLMRLKISASVGTPNVRGYLHGRSY